MAVGGSNPGVTAVTEQYNGSSWTEVSDLATARAALGSGKNGTTDSGIVFGGSSNTTATEEWNTGAAVTVTFDDS